MPKSNTSELKLLSEIKNASSEEIINRLDSEFKHLNDDHRKAALLALLRIGDDAAADYLVDALGSAVKRKRDGEDTDVISGKYEEDLRGFLLGVGSAKRDLSLKRFFLANLLYAIKEERVRSLRDDEKLLRLLQLAAAHDDDALAIALVYFSEVLEDETNAHIKLFLRDSKNLPLILKLNKYLKYFSCPVQNEINQYLFAGISERVVKRLKDSTKMDIRSEETDAMSEILVYLSGGEKGFALKAKVLESIVGLFESPKDRIFILQRDADTLLVAIIPHLFSNDVDKKLKVRLWLAVTKLLTDTNGPIIVSSKIIDTLPLFLSYLSCSSADSRLKTQVVSVVVSLLEDDRDVIQAKALTILLDCLSCLSEEVEETSPIRARAINQVVSMLLSKYDCVKEAAVKAIPTMLLYLLDSGEDKTRKILMMNRLSGILTGTGTGHITDSVTASMLAILLSWPQDKESFALKTKFVATVEAFLQKSYRRSEQSQCIITVNKALPQLFKGEEEQVLRNQFIANVANWLDGQPTRLRHDFVPFDMAIALSILPGLTNNEEEAKLKTALLNLVVEGLNKADGVTSYAVVSEILSYFSKSKADLEWKEAILSGVLNALNNKTKPYVQMELMKNLPELFSRLSDAESDMKWKQLLLEKAEANIDNLPISLEAGKAVMRGVVPCLSDANCIHGSMLALLKGVEGEVWDVIKKSHEIPDMTKQCLLELHHCFQDKKYLQYYEPHLEGKGLSAKKDVIDELGDYIKEILERENAAVKLSQWWKRSNNVLKKQTSKPEKNMAPSKNNKGDVKQSSSTSSQTERLNKNSGTAT